MPMKAQGMPMETIVLLVIVMIAVSVGLIFLFVSYSQGKTASESSLQVGEQGSEQGVSIIEQELFKANCAKRCTYAKSIAGSNTREEICESIRLQSPKIQNSGYCNDEITIDSKDYRCDKFPEAEPCVLVFEDAQVQLSCAGAYEKC